MSEQDKFEMMEILTEEQQQEILHLKKVKKRNYIVGLSLTGVFAIALIATYVLAANVWLIDYENMSYITFSYPALVEEGEERTATIVSIKTDSNYPAEFRIPAKINGYRVTAIGDGAFGGCDRLTKVIMTDNITNIGAYAFAGCENLSEIIFSKNIEVLGTNAFENTHFYNNLSQDKVSAIHGILFFVGENIISEKTVILSDHESVIPASYTSSAYNIVYMDDWVESGDSPIKVWGDGLFANMEGLVYCELPNIKTFVTVPVDTFRNCINLEGISFPDSIIEVDDNAFDGCSALENIEISSQIKKIGPYAFANSGVVNPVLPETLEKIEEYAFSGAINITKINWPDSLNAISESLFENCLNLSEFNFSDQAYKTITLMKPKAFKNTALKTFDIPLNIDSLPESLFEGSSQLTTVRAYQGKIEYDRHGETSSTGITKINKAVFNECESFDSLILVDDERHDVTPNHEVNFPITCATVADNPLIFGGTKIKKVTIPYNLSSIGREMFANNLELEEAIIETKRVENRIVGISKVEYRAFYNATSLTTLNIPDTVSVIETGAFENCENITDLKLPQNDSLKVIHFDLFKNMKKLKHLDLPAKTTSIEEGAFYQNFDLDYVVIPLEDVSKLSLGKNAFSKCRPEGSSEKMPIFLNGNENDIKSTIVSSQWYDTDTCEVFWADEWEWVDVGGVLTPTPLV